MLELFDLCLVYHIGPHKYTTDSWQARPFTRPDTAIQDIYTTKKKYLLKPASSSLSSTECQNKWYDSVAIHWWHYD